jgi:hypothetical protein
MVQCEKCGKDFKFRYLLLKHQNRKKTCETLDNIKVVYDDKIKNFNDKIKDIEDEIKIKTNKSLKKITKCMFCNNPQSNRANMLRHFRKYCNVKKQLLEDINKLNEDKNKLLNKQEIKIKDEEIKIRDEKIKELENKLKSKTNTNTNTTINNNITINNNQNNIVVINPFGKEDLSHLSLEDYKKFLNGFFPGFLKYIEKVHFDENAPQNHNIYIPNLKSKYLSVHDGDKWVTRMKNDIIDRFINKKHSQLTDKCEELEEANKISKKILDNYEEFCENFTNKEAQKSTKNNVLLMLYDNKDKIKIKKNSNLKKIEEINENSDEDIKPIKKLKTKTNLV